MTNDTKLAMLRIQLYTAMQTLKGDELVKFFALIDEIHGDPFHRPASRNEEKTG